MCPGLGAAQQKLRPSRTTMARSLKLSLQMSIRSKIIVQCYNSRFIKNLSYFNIIGNNLLGLKLPLAVSLEMKDIVLVVYRLKCTNRDCFLIASPVLSRNVIFQSARCPMMQTCCEMNSGGLRRSESEVVSLHSVPHKPPAVSS